MRCRSGPSCLQITVPGVVVFRVCSCIGLPFSKAHTQGWPVWDSKRLDAGGEKSAFLLADHSIPLSGIKGNVFLVAFLFYSGLLPLNPYHTTFCTVSSACFSIIDGAIQFICRMYCTCTVRITTASDIDKLQAMT